jgi:hypothetical protein
LNDLRFAFRQLAGSPGFTLAAGVGVLALLGFFPPRLQAGANPAGKAVPPLTFTLKDQFDREYTQALCAGKIAIVLVADREGSKFCGQWGDAIGRGLPPGAGSAVQWVPVAILPPVPAFMQGFVKSKFPQDKTQWTLMDWGGRLATAYGLPAKCCNVLVFDPDGRLLLRTGGREVDPAMVAAVVAAVTGASSSTRP